MQATDQDDKQRSARAAGKATARAATRSSVGGCVMNAMHFL